MTKPAFVHLPYRADSGFWMERLAGLEGCAFLDSGPTRQPAARYDILTAQPAAIIEPVPARHVFDELRTALRDLAPGRRVLSDPVLRKLPFVGGAIGYLGYQTRDDLIRFRARGEAGRPAPRLPVARLGIYQWALINDHARRECLLFFLPDCPASTRDRVQQALRRESRAEEFSADNEEFHLTSRFHPSMTPAQYSEAFHRLKDWIGAGDCYQANLAQRFHAGCQGDPWRAYARLRKHSHSPFSAYLDAGNDRHVMSLSPERFLRVTGRRVETRPIKGTRPRGRSEREDRALAGALQHSAKDRAENLMIVDLLRNDLGSCCATGSVRVEKLFELETYTAVHHLVSSISAELRDDHDALAVLEACFPGGSITGAPKIRAMQIIDELEPDNRSVYCGSILRAGFDGSLDSNIAIRTMVRDANHLYCWGGGGIVADSDCDAEYQETLDKISLLIRSLEDEGYA